MKKVLSVLLAMAIALGILTTIPVLATETTSEVLETYEDGSYLVLETTQTSISTYATTITKEATNTLHYYNNNDVEQWYYYIHARFIIRTGEKAICQYYITDYKILNSDWSYDKGMDIFFDDMPVAGSTTVFGEITMKRTFLFVTVETVTEKATITCDKNGNLSHTPVT